MHITLSQFLSWILWKVFAGLYKMIMGIVLHFRASSKKVVYINQIYHTFDRGDVIVRIFCVECL